MSLGYLHDLNNALTGVASFNDIALEELDSDHPVKGHLAHVKDNARRAGRLGADLGRLLAPAPESGSIQDLNRVIPEAMPLLRPAVPRRIELITELGPDHLLVRASARQLRHALFQWVMTAAESIVSKGVIRINTQAMNAWPPAGMRDNPAMPGPYAILAITDTGVGFDAEALGKLWHGAWSAKTGGHGSVMDLAPLRHWARDRGGALSLASVHPAGTVFRMGLPLVSEEALELSG